MAQILTEHPHLLGADLAGWSALWHNFSVPTKVCVELMKNYSEELAKQDPAHAFANMAALRSYGMTDHVRGILNPYLLIITQPNSILRMQFVSTYTSGCS